MNLTDDIARKLAKRVFDEIDPRTDSDLDDCLDIINAATNFSPDERAMIADALYDIADSDPH